MTVVFPTPSPEDRKGSLSVEMQRQQWRDRQANMRARNRVKRGLSAIPKPVAPPLTRSFCGWPFLCDKPVLARGMITGTELCSKHYQTERREAKASKT